jgi:ABC-type cobalamin/Fe3+-siderophores transport system ATPase subunit
MPPLLLLQEINVTFGVTTLPFQHRAGRCGPETGVYPVGRNGSGKSTLLALLLAAPNLRRGAQLRR